MNRESTASGLIRRVEETIFANTYIIIHYRKSNAFEKIMLISFSVFCDLLFVSSIKKIER